MPINIMGYSEVSMLFCRMSQKIDGMEGGEQNA